MNTESFQAKTEPSQTNARSYQTDGGSLVPKNVPLRPRTKQRGSSQADRGPPSAGSSDRWKALSGRQGSLYVAQINTSPSFKRGPLRPANGSLTPAWGRIRPTEVYIRPTKDSLRPSEVKYDPLRSTKSHIRSIRGPLRLTQGPLSRGALYRVGF